MLTLSKLLAIFEEQGKLSYLGKHYQSDEPVWVGDLWRLWPSEDGLEKKNQNRLIDLMERKGMQLRFDDEVISDEQGRAHEEHPGYHGQVSTWQYLGDTMWTQDEALESTSAYIDALLEEDLNARATRWLSAEQMEEQGFQRFNYDAESGFHPGQTDTPESVVARLKNMRPEATDIIFVIDDVGQFDMSFSAWYRLPEEEERDDWHEQAQDQCESALYWNGR